MLHALGRRPPARRPAAGGQWRRRRGGLPGRPPGNLPFRAACRLDPRCPPAGRPPRPANTRRSCAPQRLPLRHRSPPAAARLARRARPRDGPPSAPHRGAWRPRVRPPAARALPGARTASARRASARRAPRSGAWRRSQVPALQLAAPAESCVLADGQLRRSAPGWSGARWGRRRRRRRPRSRARPPGTTSARHRSSAGRDPRGGATSARGPSRPGASGGPPATGPRASGRRGHPRPRQAVPRPGAQTARAPTAEACRPRPGRLGTWTLRCSSRGQWAASHPRWRQAATAPVTQ
mmetsp:Transcript_11412/g.36454  ORF Transcript_11412/g.36454 Transcript_11412/m.36454 type:complete len:294 (-) Transcript_11412:795-1676(-)